MNQFAKQLDLHQDYVWHNQLNPDDYIMTTILNTRYSAMYPSIYKNGWMTPETRALFILLHKINVRPYL